MYVLEKKGKVTCKCSGYRLVERGQAIGKSRIIKVILIIYSTGNTARL